MEVCFESEETRRFGLWAVGCNGFGFGAVSDWELRVPEGLLVGTVFGGWPSVKTGEGPGRGHVKNCSAPMML